MERAVGPCCHCSVTKAPTARTIPARGNAPRNGHPNITLHNPRAEGPAHPSKTFADPAPGDGRAPSAIAPPTRWNNLHHLSPPHFSALHFSALHSSAMNRNGDRHVVQSRWTFGRRICVIETGPTSVVGFMRPGTGALPARLIPPKRWGDPRHLSPAHVSASHFSAIPFFVLFRFFRLSPKNHLPVLSVSQNNKKTTKKRPEPRR